MRIVALVDIHPLDGGQKRGLSMRIANGGSFFDLPVSREQASLILSKVSPEEPPAPAPPTEEEMSLFTQFSTELGMDDDAYDEDDDL